MSLFDGYLVGIIVGLLCGLGLGFVLWKVPSLQLKYMEQTSMPKGKFNYMGQKPKRKPFKPGVDSTEEFLKLLADTPLRSMDDIREDREPEWVEPVIALGMLPEKPEKETVSPPPRLSFTGPPLWRVADWLTWNFGDVLINWSTHERQQDRSGPRVLQRL